MWVMEIYCLVSVRSFQEKKPIHLVFSYIPHHYGSCWHPAILTAYLQEVKSLWRNLESSWESSPEGLPPAQDHLPASCRSPCVPARSVRQKHNSRIRPAVHTWSVLCEIHLPLERVFFQQRLFFSRASLQFIIFTTAHGFLKLIPSFQQSFWQQILRASISLPLRSLHNSLFTFL